MANERGRKREARQGGDETTAQDIVLRIASHASRSSSAAGAGERGHVSAMPESEFFP